MRWNHETLDEKEERKGKWRRFFAWHPVLIKSQPKQKWVWLECVERRQTYHSDWGESWWISEYRDLQKKA